MTEPVLAVRDLRVSFPSEAGRVDAVRGVDFDLFPGRTLGIVGESGSGKSVTSMAVMGLLPDYAAVSGSVTLGGRELLELDDRTMSEVRGRELGMIFQDPLSSLTPIFTVGRQIVEALQVHQDLDRDVAWKRAVELLDLVGIPNASVRARSFPHEFSGGMRQRVVIAMAIANDPRVIIADEPTTALDVTVQAQVLEVLKLAQVETGAALIMITHDLGVVAGAADEVMVMYAGRPVEKAPVDELFSRPRMPYTIGLLGAVPRVDTAERVPLVPIQGNPPLLIDQPPGCPFAPRCPISIPECTDREPALVPVSTHVDHSAACIRAAQIQDGRIGDAPVYPLPTAPDAPAGALPREQRPPVLELDGLSKTFPVLKGALLKRRVGWVYAVSDVDLDIREGETLGLVGESGCGKTTTLIEIMNLRPPQHGGIRVGGVDVESLRGRGAERELRRRLQMVFQDPTGSLDPRLTVFDILAEPLQAVGEKDRSVIDNRVDELMELVGLDPEHGDRFPTAFSGGQRQRIGIARALATNPSLVVLDEPVSALDVSIQAGVINLLNELKAKLGLSYLFVSHDLSVVRHISDRVAVMYLGRIVEVGAVDEVFGHPQHPYTEALLSAIPVPDPRLERVRKRVILRGDLPSPTDSTPGCRFVSRCPLHLTLNSDTTQSLSEQAQFNPQPYENIRDGGTLTTALPEITPQFNTWQSDGTLYTLMLWRWYNPVLITFTADGDAVYNPDYLTDVKQELVDGNTRITYTINPKATYNDGTPIDWRSFEAVWKTNGATNPAYIVSSSDGYDRIASVTRGVDDRQAVVTFRGVNLWWQSLFNNLIHPNAVDPQVFNQGYIDNPHPEWGAGPYQIQNFDKQNGTITFVRNPKWWGKTGKLDSRTFLTMEDAASINAFKNGQLDATGVATKDRLAQVQGMTGIDIRKSIEPALDFFTLNGQSPILADPAVRKAVFEGIDRQQLQEIEFQGLNLTAQLPGSMVLLPFQDGYQDNFAKVITFDPEQAKQGLQAAGWTPGPDGIRVKDGKPLEFTYVNTGDDPTGKAVASATAAMFRNIGVRLNIRQVPASEYSAIVTGKQFDMFYSGITQTDPYGIAYICQIYCSDSTLLKSGVNSPALDAQLRAVNQLPTPQEQYVKANEVETEAFKTYGIMPTINRPAIVAVKQGLANYGAGRFFVATPETIGWQK